MLPVILSTGGPQSSKPGTASVPHVCQVRFKLLKVFARAAAWLLMRLALFCVAVGEILADLAVHCATLGSQQC